MYGHMSKSLLEVAIEPKVYYVLRTSILNSGFSWGWWLIPIVVFFFFLGLLSLS